MKKNSLRTLLLTGIGLFFMAFVFFPPFSEAVLKLLFPGVPDRLYSRAPLPELLLEHFLVVLISEFLAVLTGCTLGIFVTRKRGKIYLPMVQSLASMAQTFPPTAVLALAIPLAGFGFKPVVLALFIYSCFPVISNTVSGLNSVKGDLIEASRGLGMTDNQILRKTELPLAAPVILAGIRTSTIINIGTATIGAVAGAGGLGTVLMAGLIHDNGAYIFTGALCAALLAFFTDKLFALLDSRYRRQP
ncbi:MAG: ABC transporter permease [Spirochaetales bacterium]|nr:ABC transporter permease [Spirochaetales bacterium]